MGKREDTGMALNPFPSHTLDQVPGPRCISRDSFLITLVLRQTRCKGPGRLPPSTTGCFRRLCYRGYFWLYIRTMSSPGSGSLLTLLSRHDGIPNLTDLWPSLLRCTPGYVACSQVSVLSLFLLLIRCSYDANPGLGSIIFGYDLGVIAGVLPAPDFIVRNEHTPESQDTNAKQRVMGSRYNNPNLQGLIASIFGVSSPKVYKV